MRCVRNDFAFAVALCILIEKAMSSFLLYYILTLVHMPDSFIQTETKCEILKPDGSVDMQCDELVIKPNQEGYPTKTASYSFKACNYNNDNIGPIALGTAKSSKSFFEFFYPDLNDRTGQIQQSFIVQKVLTENLNTGDCRESSGTMELRTNRSTYYMKSQMSAPLSTRSKPEDFCYSYDFAPIEFQYDYGYNDCSMNVSQRFYYIVSSDPLHMSVVPTEHSIFLYIYIYIAHHFLLDNVGVHSSR